MIDIIPAIGLGSNTFDQIEEKIRLVAPHVTWIQIDISDGTMVPTISVLSFEPLVQLMTQEALAHLSFEAHLLVADPQKYIRPLASLGFKRIVAHSEANDPRLFLTEAKYESVEIGMALDGPSSIDILEPYLEEIDYVLLQMNEAGVKNLPFDPEQVEKIADIRRFSPDMAIEVEGGMNETTAKLVRDAGANRIVSTNYLFSDPNNIPQAIAMLKGIETSN